MAFYNFSLWNDFYNEVEAAKTAADDAWEIWQAHEWAWESSTLAGADLRACMSKTAAEDYVKWQEADGKLSAALKRAYDWELRYGD